MATATLTVRVADMPQFQELVRSAVALVSALDADISIECGNPTCGWLNLYPDAVAEAADELRAALVALAGRSSEEDELPTEVDPDLVKEVDRL